jgi:hypothetical protein
MTNVAVASRDPVTGEYGTYLPPPPSVPSQLFGPRKNGAAAGRSCDPAQPLIVIWTVEPSGAWSGQTVIDVPARELLTVLQPSVVTAAAEVGADGAEEVAGGAARVSLSKTPLSPHSGACASGARSATGPGG